MNDARRTLLLLSGQEDAGVDRAGLGAHCSVIDAEGLNRALELFRTAPTDAVVIALNEPDRALTALNAFTSEFGANAAAYVLVTRCDQLRLGIDAWRGGAHDCVEQHDSDDAAALWLRISAAIDKAARQRRLEQTSERFEARQRQLHEAIDARRAAEGALKDADHRQDEFLAMLAGELRNPLAPIQNAVALVRLMAPADPQLRGIADMIDRQTRHMTRLVDDLLELSRVALGKLDLRRERLDIVRVLYSGIEAASPAIEARRQQLDLDLPSEPLYTEGDFTRLAQVVGNLLQNAAKFTAEGGHIWLSASAEGGEVVIRVRDNGVGISAELLPRIFDLFAQGGPLEKRKGLGIGLALVKRLVELHKGSVHASSAGVGNGAEFAVRLPRALSARARQNDLGTAQRDEAATRRVLIVDDNGDAAESLALVLRLSGYEVTTASDGHSALEAAALLAPDVIVLDIGLPDMTGYEVAQALRNTSAGRNALLIALTGFSQPEHQQRTRASGFDHHLVKPVDPNAVHALLKRRHPEPRSEQE